MAVRYDSSAGSRIIYLYPTTFERFGESVKKWLEKTNTMFSVRIFGLRGFAGATGKPLFFRLGIGLITWRLGIKGSIWLNFRLLPNCMCFTGLYGVLVMGYENCILWYLIYEIMSKILFACHGSTVDSR